MVCFFSESRLRRPCARHDASHDAGNSLSGLPDLHTSRGAGPMFSCVPMISCSFIKIFMPGQRVFGSRQRVTKAHDPAHDGLTKGSRRAHDRLSRRPSRRGEVGLRFRGQEKFRNFLVRRLYCHDSDPGTRFSLGNILLPFVQTLSFSL